MPGEDAEMITEVCYLLAAIAHGRTEFLAHFWDMVNTAQTFWLNEITEVRRISEMLAALYQAAGLPPAAVDQAVNAKLVAEFLAVQSTGPGYNETGPPAQEAPYE
jgi:hypothetical protein